MSDAGGSYSGQCINGCGLKDKEGIQGRRRNTSRHSPSARGRRHRGSAAPALPTATVKAALRNDTTTQTPDDTCTRLPYENNVATARFDTGLRTTTILKLKSQ